MISHHNSEVWDLLNVGKNFFDSKIRNIATKRIAEILGLENIVINCQMATLEIAENPETDGCLSDDARGIDFFEFRKKLRNKNVLPSFINDLYNLEVLDCICTQTDRCPWNYSIITTQSGTPKHLVGYDNDLSFGIYDDCSSFPLWGSSPLVNHEGQINRPHIDKNLANKILSLTDEQIEDNLFDILEPKYIKSTKNRVNQIKRAIQKSTKIKQNFLVDNWEEVTTQQTRKPARTYLSVFREKLK